MGEYYLYVKTHNITGLKYLGQTKRNPFSYLGSGIRWTRHLKLHGCDISTQIVGVYDNKEELKKQGIFYSELWNVKNSTEWANLVEESGMGGDLRSGKIHTEESKQRISAAKKGIPLSEEHKHNISKGQKGRKSWNKGSTWPEEIKQKISETAKNSRNKGRFVPGHTHSEESKRRMSVSRKGRIPWNKGTTGYKHKQTDHEVLYTNCSFGNLRDSIVGYCSSSCRSIVSH